MKLQLFAGLFTFGAGEGNQTLPDPLPSTFEYIDLDYQGHRFEGQQVLVFGGTSGIGFATAAMMVQECALRTVVVGRNEKKCKLAVQVIQQRASQAHCRHRGVVECHPADITKRNEVRSVFSSFSTTNNGKLPVVVQAASIGGYMGNFADIPDDILFTGRDAIFNNLYGTKAVMQEALRFWGKTGCIPLNGLPCSELDYLPSLVVVSSENGMNPTPTAEMYGASKHGMIGLTTSIAAAFPGEVRINAVLPGLIDTPLTWNQVRRYEMLPNGTAVLKHPALQPSWQCIVDGQFVENGECAGGGTGYGCPCEDVRLDDPRNAAVWGALGHWPAIDPRQIGDAILEISENGSTLTGVTRVVDHGQWQCDEAGSYPGEAKPKFLWEFCPRLQRSSALV